MSSPPGCKTLVLISWLLRYLNFGDICFQLKDPTDEKLNLYWKSRDSAMLIRGGSNYAYEQVQGELNKFVEEPEAMLQLLQVSPQGLGRWPVLAWSALHPAAAVLCASRLFRQSTCIATPHIVVFMG